MSKEEFEQRCGKKSLREMLSAVEERVGKLEESIDDAKESDNTLGEIIDNLREQSKDFVAMCFTSNRDKEEARAKLQGITQRGTVGEYVREFKELKLQVSDVIEKEALLTFQNGLKPWVRQEVEQRGVQKLSKAMMVVESVVKLSLGKDKLGSSNFEEKCVCKRDHKEDVVDGNDNDDNGGNGKLR
ncbi:hypothetical protein Gotri_010624, partial [Gossypium trilobum]|nr:hypothetical protein [Gossypium trilobum]